MRSRFLNVLVARATVAVLAAATFGSAQEAKIRIDDPVYPGDKVITGTQAAKDVEIEVYVNLRQVKTPKPVRASADGSWSAPLESAVASGNVVQAKQTVAGKDVLSDPVTVVVQRPLPPSLDSPLKCGASEITGRLGVASPAARLRLLVNNQTVDATFALLPEGRFKIAPATKLNGGNAVVVEQSAGGQVLRSTTVTVESCASVPSITLAPPSIDEPHHGDEKIAGSVPVDSPKPTIRVNGQNLDNKDVSVVKGQWEAAYTSGLKENMLIEVEQFVKSVDDKPRQATAVVAAATQKPPLLVLNRVVEGDPSVTGNIDLGILKDVKQIKVEVRRDGDRQLQTLYVEPNSKGEFSAQPAVPLAESMLVVATGLNDKGAPVNRVAQTRNVDSALFDWGRARSYFSLGTVLARSKGDFGDPQVYVGFNSDFNVYNRNKYKDTRAQNLAKNLSLEQVQGDIKRLNALKASRRNAIVQARIKATDKDKPKPKADEVDVNQVCREVLKKRDNERLLRLCEALDDLQNQPRGNWLLNTYFDGRLTQNGAVKSSESSGAPINPPSIVQSKNSAYVEMGAYAPIYAPWSSWNFRGEDQAVFIAPILKGGFLTVKASDVTDILLANDVYRFLHAGARIGHLHVSASGNVMPELVSYIDFTWGRFDNYRRLIPEADRAKENATYAYPSRFEVHGRAKIPQTPFTIGFTVNTGSGPDDAQVFIGTRFDATKFLKKLLPGTP